MPSPTGSVRVVVTANARIWFDGELTSQTGPVRVFTPPPGTDNATHTVEARWSREGREVHGGSTIQVHTGQRVTVDFVTPEVEKKQ
jgi:uncharacterized protein (TIGR03000 family)